MYRIKKITTEKVQPKSRNPKNTEVSEGALIRLNASVVAQINANKNNGNKASR